MKIFTAIQIVYHCLIIILDLKNTNLLKNIEDIKKPTDVKPNSFVIIDGSITIHGSGEWLDSKYPDFTKNPTKKLGTNKRI